MKQKSMNDCSYFFPLFSLSICSIRCRLAIVPVVTTIDQFVYLIFYVRGFIIKRFILDRINGTYSKNINVNVFRRQEEMSTSIVVFRYCKHDCFPITQIELVIHKTDDQKRVLTKENSYMKVDLPIHRIIIPIRCEKRKIFDANDSKWEREKENDCVTHFGKAQINNCQKHFGWISLFGLNANWQLKPLMVI